MMRRLLPFPLFSLGLLLLWLLLVQSVSPAHVLLGSCLALIGGQTLRILDVERVDVLRPVPLLMLTGIVLLDIVRSNIAVARIILGARKHDVVSDFIDIPLDIRSRYALTILAIIITATPGTVWADYDPDSGVLTIHVLDLIDKEIWSRIIKERYERRLKEAFE